MPLEPPIFLELLGVTDPTQSDGAWLAQTLGGEDRVLWWCLGVNDIEESADRRGLPIHSSEMEMVDGPSRFFRTAGMPNYPLPFFISFDMDRDELMELRRARLAEAAHDCEPGDYTWVEVGRHAGDAEGLAGRPRSAPAPPDQPALGYPGVRHRNLARRDHPALVLSSLSCFCSSWVRSTCAQSRIPAAAPSVSNCSECMSSAART